MAEFQYVIQQFDRMCNTCAGCIGCPLRDPDGISDKCSIGEFVVDPSRIEQIVIQWAKDHPEPKPISWGQYLCDIGLIGDCVCFDEVVNRLFNNYIPEETVEKLGLRDKEPDNA